MSVTLAYSVQVSVRETLETNIPATTSGNRVLVHNQYNSTQNLNSTTTPPVTKVAAFLKTLAAGAATITLTSLTGSNGVTVDGTDLKVQIFKIYVWLGQIAKTR